MTKQNNILKRILLLSVIFSMVTAPQCIAKAKIPSDKICRTVMKVQSGIYQDYEIVKCDKLYGVKNSFSRVAIPPKYSKIENLDNIHLKIKLNKLYGIADYSGKVIVEPKYKDIATAKIELSTKDAHYLYMGKIKRNWYVINDEKKEIPLVKNKHENLQVKNTLRTAPHKLQVENKKYYLRLGTIEMNELLSGTPVWMLISDNVPKWTFEQISQIGLMSIFNQKKK